MRSNKTLQYFCFPHALLAKAFQVREHKQWRINDGTSMKRLPAVCLLQWFLTAIAPPAGLHEIVMVARALTCSTTGVLNRGYIYPRGLI